MDKVKETFYNPKEGFINLDKLYKKLHEKGIKISRQKLEEFYKKQAITQNI